MPGRPSKLMLLQNQIINGTYQILSPIGSGGTSSVYLGYHLRLQKNVVIKQLRGTFSKDFLLRTEVDILKNLHHPCLPQVYDFIQDQDSVYTVIDYVDGYDLDAYIRSGTKFPEPYIKRYLRQIAEVLDYLHSQSTSVIHSDIKPGNIIINQEGNAILIDFNTSIGGNQGNLLGLTMPYASPEQIELARYAVYGRKAPFEMDGRSDLYSLGATFYELISGIRPTPGVPPAPLHTMGLTEYSRDLLVLIDRLMAYDREKRIKSAKKLVTAIERLDSRYKTYFVLRCVSLLLSAAMIGGGLYCLIRGSQRKTLETYMNRYQTASAYVTQGYLDQAEQICDQIISDGKMQAFFQKSPGELAKFYHILGDISYYREEYGTAAAYYRYASDHCPASEQSNRSVYLRDAAIAAAESGDLRGAAALLEKAREENAAGEDLQLIALVIHARSGDFEKCSEGARQLLATCQNPTICRRAAMAAASAAKDISTRIAWLETARAYDSGRTTLRALAVAYGEKAQQADTAVVQQAALREACNLYSQLCDSVYASANDRLNYSIVLRMAGDEDAARQVLLEALNYDPENYRILANLCFISYEQGDSSNASAYCAAALKAWQEDTSADRMSETEEEILNLLEIARRFGIGGIK